jgi:predicted nuclease of predicted toxin-antitoxin system
MSTVRFLADEDLRRAIVLATVRVEPAVEFVRAQDVDLSGRQDAEVLQFATANGFCVVSHDVNTMPGAAAELQAKGDCCGPLLVAQDKPTRAVAESLVLIWSAAQAEELRNVVLYLPF